LERLAVRQKWLSLANSNRKWLCKISWMICLNIHMCIFSPRLFVGSISTAFAGSVLMAVINLYLFILYFTNKNLLLKTQTGKYYQ
jgi:hypothetical protein